MIKVINPRNKGGIRATLKHYYKQYKLDKIGKSIYFDGVELRCCDYGNQLQYPFRYIGDVEDIETIDNWDSETLHDFLYSDI